MILDATAGNNGWIKINGPEDLPQEIGVYIVLGKFGVIERWEYYQRNDHFWLEYFTHWRPIVEIPGPVY